MLSHTWLCEQSSNICTPECQVWIAYSGGIDSHVLLHLAQQLFPKLRAIHINDHQSPNSDKWQQHCQQVCAQLQIPLQCVSVNIEQNSNLENAARNARRAVWQNMLGADDVLLLAHHADDQAETILYRLMRGTGPHGLVGMRPITRLGTAKLWRPLLNTSKQEILTYAREHNLSWVEDETNQNLDFDRNYLRQQVLPLLQQRWPALKNNLNRTGSLTAQLLDAAQPAIQAKLSVVKNGQELELSLWQQLEPTWRIETLRAWLQEHKIMLSYQRLQTIVREVINARSDAQPQYKIAENIVLRRSMGKLHVLQLKSASKFEHAQSWDLNSELLLPNGTKLMPQDLAIDPEFRQKLSTQEIIVKLGTHGRKAKKIFQQFSIPPWERHKYPLVFANSRLISIVGLWFSSRI